MATVDLTRHHIGSVLVALQLGLIAGLAVLAAPAFLNGVAPAGAWALAAGGVMLGLWALYFNRPGNFNIRPAPRAGGQLVNLGPYSWVRHPMYTAVIACALACAWAATSLWGWLGAAALAGVLAVKTVFEERWMLLEHPGYAAYCARTKRFLPGLL